MQPRFNGPFFNEFVAAAHGRSPDEINQALLKKKVIGGLPLAHWYPELENCVLLCATEMSKREHMDEVAQAFSPAQQAA
ncbi:MAG: hypothetical protein DMG58_00420 [Acidobacteria bacterium]|nr:MAG: hypothetical protein DMG58_00420 [Acidobacteriota bacterium]